MGQPMFIMNQYGQQYRFNEGHPFDQRRLQLTYDLIEAVTPLNKAHMLSATEANLAQLAMVHTVDYIEAVQQLSVCEPEQKIMEQAYKYGLHEGDTPYFKNMHQITSNIVGGSIQAAEEVMSGRASHALHLAGGLHHALPGKAAGFCIYNDAAAAIAYIRQHYGARVLYVDTDVHHGDGVQWMFYTDTEVCTFSVHETGMFLFPGTGDVKERGDGEAFGRSINVPLEPYTEDDSWLACFEEGLQRIVERFKPDVILSQHGCDAHAFDPLAHMHCSMNIYLQMPRIIRETVLNSCKGRWIALGGGGYDIWRVVPRAWSLLWLVMSNHPIVKEIEERDSFALPAAWLNKCQPLSPLELPKTWLDNTKEWNTIPRRDEITAKNKQTLYAALQYL